MRRLTFHHPSVSGQVLCGQPGHPALRGHLEGGASRDGALHPHRPPLSRLLQAPRHDLVSRSQSVLSLSFISEDKGCPQEEYIARQLRLIIITTIPIIPVIIGN